MVSFSRRQFLFGSSLASLSALAACTTNETAQGPLLVALFSRQKVIKSGVLQRIPFGLVDDGSTDQQKIDETAELAVRIIKDGNVISELAVSGRIVSHEHSPDQEGVEHEHANLLRYYALRTVFPEPGIYDIEVDFPNSVATMPVQVFSPEEVTLANVGDKFPILETPTEANSLGVDPVCSLIPDPCGLHDVSAAEVIGKQPVAILFATPAFCATAYCGPVLDVLLEQVSQFPNVKFFHVEVYSNPREVNGNYNDPAIEVAGPLVEIGLDFEPSLFLIDAAGVVVDRIDNVFDGTEANAALSLL